MWERRTHVQEILVSSNENSPGVPTERPERLPINEPCDISARLGSWQPSVTSDEEDRDWSAPAMEEGADGDESSMNDTDSEGDREVSRPSQSDFGHRKRKLSRSGEGSLTQVEVQEKPKKQGKRLKKWKVAGNSTPPPDSEATAEPKLVPSVEEHLEDDP